MASHMANSESVGGRKRRGGLRILRNLLIGVVALVVVAAAASLVSNRVGASYDNLSDAQRSVIDQYGKLYEAVEKDGKSLWADDPLTDRPVLAVGSLREGALLINPSADPNPLTAVKVDVPEGSPLTVYRVAAADPSLLRTKLDPGNFGFSHAAGSDSYYVKLSSGSFATEDYSGRFVYMLSHESLHEYVQQAWPKGSQFVEGLRDEDIDLIYGQIDALNTMQQQMESGSPDHAVLKEALSSFVSLADQLQQTSPEYAKDAATKYTDEGTAQYVGMLAEEYVGVRPIHVVENGHDASVPFSYITELLKAGTLDRSFLMGRNFPYYAGAMLCQVFEELGVQGWQEQLNAQTTDNPLTVVDIARQVVGGQTA